METVKFLSKNKYHIILWLLMLLPECTIWGNPICISLYNSKQIRSVVVGSYRGALIISGDDGVQCIVDDGHSIYAAFRDGKIWLCDERNEIGSFERITVQGIDSSAVVRLMPMSPQSEAHNYEETIIMKADIDRIQIINRVDINKYIAGVVEAESGIGRTLEFYKAKAIICRTYLYRTINRHYNEGFHLCDEVHCQVFKGQNRKYEMIRQAVDETKDIIIVDQKDSKPILATYHSNCGGETESSKNVWQSSLPYLVPVTDPYCTSSPNARWTRNIPLEEWKNYLTKNGFNANPDVVTDFSFTQNRRTLNYKVNNTTIPVRKLRADWQLKSTFFSIKVENDNVILTGRGYGHGVGLCQEGAIEMGKRGFKYDEIINFYYKNIKLASVSSLQIAVPDFD